MSSTYVIGHVNPDMDTIASAIGYAWLLRERDGLDAVPARAGAFNPQTSWVMDYLNIPAPILLTDASPRFETVIRRLDSLNPDQSLREAWTVANRTGGVAPVVNLDGTPHGLVTGWSLFHFLSEGVGPNLRAEENQIGELLDAPCSDACETAVPVFRANSRIRDVINRVLREESTDFWVVDENGQYLGVCRQRDLLNPPRLQIVLVDHNEASQAIRSLDEAELIEIFDHHRLDNPATRTPIRVTVDVVGSTSTLVSERVEEAGLSVPPEIAGLLLAGLMSDTLILTSPTTTPRDHKAAQRLGRWAFRAGSILANESIESFGEKVVSAGAGLKSREPEEIIVTDMKIYTAGDLRFSVSQAEVTKFLELQEISDKLSRALDAHKQKNGLDFSMLMVTNVVGGSSRILISSDAPPILDELPYPLTPYGSRDAQGVVSRKKQLLPSVLSLLEI